MSLVDRIAKLERSAASGEMSRAEVDAAAATLLAELKAKNGDLPQIEQSADGVAKSKAGLLAQLKQLLKERSSAYP